MCSQFELKIPIKQLKNTTQSLFAKYTDNLMWNVHAYPFSGATIIAKNPTNRLKIIKYLLIPNWSKVARPKLATYNARDEHLNKASNQLDLIYNMPTWCATFKAQHCIVSITSFFKLCCNSSHVGNVVKFTQNNSIFFTAAIWDRLQENITCEVIHNFAIITDNPCNFIKEVGHDRQSVFITLKTAKSLLTNMFTTLDIVYIFLKFSQKAINYSVENIRHLKGFQHDLFS